MNVSSTLKGFLLLAAKKVSIFHRRALPISVKPCHSVAELPRLIRCCVFTNSERADSMSAILKGLIRR